MKKILILTIKVYQILFSPLLKNILGISRICRFSPTCSEYAKNSIKKYGIIEGLFKTTARVLSCQPFSIPLRNHFAKFVYTYRSFQNDNQVTKKS